MKYNHNKNLVKNAKVLRKDMTKEERHLWYDYLRNKNGQYLPNPELAEVWNAASAAVMKIDKNLGNTLYNKSRFWLDPQLYINLNREVDVIELNEIVDEMERLRKKL